jgi:hypothetical protein
MVDLNAAWAVLGAPPRQSAEGERAFGIAAGWVRAKMASTVFPVGVSAAKNAH